MIELPIKLERVVKSDEDSEVMAEIEVQAAGKGGKVSNKEKTLTELLTGHTPEETMSLNQFLENE